uniref:Ig-like domain-containing protein n=1 Tax=Anisakis simplex TaxID=6269 RepID=A0A0M3KDI2_ANISI
LPCEAEGYPPPQITWTKKFLKMNHSARPVVAQAAREVIEVIKNESAVFKCPIKDRRFIGQISW